MEELIKAIYVSIPKVVKEWNAKKLLEFENLYEQTFKEYFNDKQTQEKTKIISPIIDAIFARIMCEQINGFVIDAGRGKDYNWNGIPLESKLTLSSGNSWTGNGYKKTDYHILSKFDFNEYGLIISYFSCLVNLNDCLSKWSKPHMSNFSTLKFINEDIDKIILIYGDKEKKSKYLHFSMVKTEKHTS
jgi:hypothetical protein